MTKLKVPNSCWTLTEVSAHQTNTRWFLMDRLEQVQVTGVGMNGCSMGSDSENTQGLLLYSLTVINNVVHKDWNLINIFKLCFDIFSSSYKTLAQLCGYTGALTVWTTHPLEADCVWLLTTKAPKSRFSQHLKTAPGVIQRLRSEPPSPTGLNPSQNVPLTLVKEFCSNGILEQRITVSLTLVSW